MICGTVWLRLLKVRGQFVFYRLVADNLANTLNAYVQEVCPVSRPLKAESADLAGGRTGSEAA